MKNGPAVWADGGETLLFSANRHDERELEPRNSEIYEVGIAGREIRALTDREGPDTGPAVSPNGRTIAYLGYDDRLQGYQVTRLYIMNRDGSGSRLVSETFDRDVRNLNWSADGDGLFLGIGENS